MGKRVGGTARGMRSTEAKIELDDRKPDQSFRRRTDFFQLRRISELLYVYTWIDVDGLLFLLITCHPRIDVDRPWFFVFLIACISRLSAITLAC